MLDRKANPAPPPPPQGPDLHLWSDEEVQAMKDRGEITTEAPPPTDDVDDIPF